jgi:hypothetical protein
MRSAQRIYVRSRQTDHGGPRTVLEPRKRRLERRERKSASDTYSIIFMLGGGGLLEVE